MVCSGNENIMEIFCLKGAHSGKYLPTLATARAHQYARALLRHTKQAVVYGIS